MRTSFWAGTSLLALLVAGCTVGPDFHPPTTPQGAGYEPGVQATGTVSAAVAEGASQQLVSGRDIPAEWWALFHSRQLNAFIAEALANNPSLEAAQATLRQAREQYYAQEGTLLPTVDAAAQVEPQQLPLSEFGENGPPVKFTLYQATVSVGYAPDVFGGKRRQIESQLAAADYQRFQVEATFLTLTANVVTAAIQEASLRGQIDATNDIIKAESDQLDLMRKQFELGAAARTDVLQQESELITTQATLPGLEKQLAQQRHLLMSLVGRFPNQDRGGAFTLDLLRLPRVLPVSIPSQLVEQRPDIRAAEQQLHQATAQIGVAAANRLPQFNLTAAVGGDALSLSQLFTPNTLLESLTASATQPIFHGGQLLHQEKAAVAAAEAAEAQYRNTVLLAFRNVADTLRALRDDARTLQIQDRAVRVADESFSLSRTQFQAGAITYLTLLNAQRNYQQARLNLVQAQAARLADTAALYQALGGGWWNRSDTRKRDENAEPSLIEVVAGGR